MRLSERLQLRPCATPRGGASRLDRTSGDDAIHALQVVGSSSVANLCALVRGLAPSRSSSTYPHTLYSTTAHTSRQPSDPSVIGCFRSSSLPSSSGTRSSPTLPTALKL